ncbi:LLM class flavin-dependent oxidoreductase [Tenggerimyces flavus]|uniref:LLM class flavin-dependent oxidoreductase n=1 Tax=Tenggerimyces flavus TaxID=1708749 RepID=A0ABV7YE93_9ACTN|nr:LLM class flavin-dependent oxidoreductase [Tenggerimyces flavus]MBM7786106.1 alkanesulfonate monooxygenase SsuD/methylene tetrahydromethanopterin reductase-like flavin-dependent oxidoreductase (luciferase family) [Tenggerimyces flavus]
MRYGFVLAYGDARTAAELAQIAEEHGWDAFFCWESVWGIDPWVALTAAAMTTERIKLGTMLTPLPRRRPWELASQTATLDNLSGGRVILPIGLGVPSNEPRFWLFEDDPGRKVRAELMDEGIDMLRLLWKDKTFTYEGTHYRSRALDTEPMPGLPPTPVQPTIPIWAVGAWPRMKSMKRAAQLEGWLPAYHPTDPDADKELTPQILAEAVAWIREERAKAGRKMDDFDVIWEGKTPADDPAAGAAKAREWADAGATWWLEADWDSFDPNEVRQASERRLRAGPPRIEV